MGHADGESGIGVQSPETGAPTELRYYWNPRRRLVVYVAGASAAILIEVVLASGRFPSPNPRWLLVPMAVLWVLIVPWLAWHAGAPGVRETPTGLEWRAGRRDPIRRGSAPWVEIRGFYEYEVPILGDRIAVILTNNKRKDIWGARAVMRWRDCETNDFAQLLTERAQSFGAPIEPRP